jgi:hypothetical protein
MGNQKLMTKNQISARAATVEPLHHPANSITLDFKILVKAITVAHAHFAAKASKAVNLALTARNWFIGWYIEEYIRKGIDRAVYGERLMECLSAIELSSAGGEDRSLLESLSNHVGAKGAVASSRQTELWFSTDKDR